MATDPFVSIQTDSLKLLRIKAPEMFRDKDFLEWLNRQDNRACTNHYRGTPFKPAECGTVVFVRWQGAKHCTPLDTTMPLRWQDRIRLACAQKGYDGPALICLANEPAASPDAPVFNAAAEELRTLKAQLEALTGRIDALSKSLAR